ncbi:MAG: transcriptional regulator [Nocardioides sp.]|nr:transcriptional regulator [Nocardioides sp.]
MATPTNTQFAVAVHVLVYLASVGRNEQRSIGSEELAGSTAVNPVHVRRVLGPLRTAGLVHSKPGAKGGWEIGADPREIGLDRVWAVLQGDDPVLGLHGPSPRCAVGAGVQEILQGVEREVSAAVVDRLARRSIADLVTEAHLEAAVGPPR